MARRLSESEKRRVQRSRRDGRTTYVGDDGGTYLLTSLSSADLSSCDTGSGGGYDGGSYGGDSGGGSDGGGGGGGDC